MNQKLINKIKLFDALASQSLQTSITKEAIAPLVITPAALAAIVALTTVIGSLGAVVDSGIVRQKAQEKKEELSRKKFEDLQAQAFADAKSKIRIDMTNNYNLFKTNLAPKSQNKVNDYLKTYGNDQAIKNILNQKLISDLFTQQVLNNSHYTQLYNYAKSYSDAFVSQIQNPPTNTPQTDNGLSQFSQLRKDEKQNSENEAQNFTKSLLDSIKTTPTGKQIEILNQQIKSAKNKSLTANSLPARYTSHRIAEILSAQLNKINPSTPKTPNVQIISNK